MATEAEGQPQNGPTTKRPAARRAKAGAKGRKRATAKRRPKAREINELEAVIRGLETRLAEFTNTGIRSAVTGASNQVGKAASRASNQVGEVVADTLTEVATRLLSGATSVTGTARMGAGAMARIGTELERRPFMTVAIALGIGFLAGLAGRRDAA
jgi:ElaB/YqjD/DUF883 family membrane-anchored ribosome-binding protein